MPCVKRHSLLVMRDISPAPPPPYAAAVENTLQEDRNVRDESVGRDEPGANERHASRRGTDSPGLCAAEGAEGRPSRARHDERRALLAPRRGSAFATRDRRCGHREIAMPAGPRTFATAG